MAIGIGKMFNIELPINFDSPYQAASIREFWKRWHITLTRFLTKYVYIPLGGGKKGTVRTCCNIMIVFLCSGIWHGANWTFVVWGFLHGIIQVIERLGDKFLMKIPKFIRWGMTFLFVNAAWVFFRADNLKSAILFFDKMLDFKTEFPLPVKKAVETINEVEVLNALGLEKFLLSYIQYILLIVLIMFIVVMFKENTIKRAERMQYTWKTLIACVFVFVYSVVSLTGINEFLYFNF